MPKIKAEKKSRQHEAIQKQGRILAMRSSGRNRRILAR